MINCFQIMLQNCFQIQLAPLQPGYGARWRGKAAQVDPNKHTLKAPGTKRLKLKYDEMLSSFAFNFNLRRYSGVWCCKRANWVDYDDEHCG